MKLYMFYIEFLRTVIYLYRSFKSNLMGGNLGTARCLAGVGHQVSLGDQDEKLSASSQNYLTFRSSFNSFPSARGKVSSDQDFLEGVGGRGST